MITSEPIRSCFASLFNSIQVTVSCLFPQSIPITFVYVDKISQVGL